MILMCKNTKVYDIDNNTILNEYLLPGAINNGIMDYLTWMKTRYSVGSNVSARRLMLRAFGSDNHNSSLKVTRALSLSDCYWLKEKDENILFENVTPYLNKEWDGTGQFTGGSISTLFVNGAANKKWIDKDTLVKFNSSKEIIPFQLAEKLELNLVPKTWIKEGDFYIENFTSMSVMLETMEQSGFVKDDISPQELAIDVFKEDAVSLFVLDYLVEHDDRHWGNFGYLRDTNTGQYLGMAYYYDFDWAWSDAVVPLPQNALLNYSTLIKYLAKKAIQVSDEFEDNYRNIITKRAKELLREKLYKKDDNFTPSNNF
ncbi:MAG: hypothetical protein FWF57_00585 [Defluviitaleaceae bacterium]|nr:hypothetical protein [Defluviitaleaceae bacterium]